jgi:hypothetical protein
MDVFFYFYLRIGRDASVSFLFGRSSRASNSNLIFLLRRHHNEFSQFLISDGGASTAYWLFQICESDCVISTARPLKFTEIDSRTLTLVSIELLFK